MGEIWDRWILEHLLHGKTQGGKKEEKKDEKKEDKKDEEKEAEEISKDDDVPRESYNVVKFGPKKCVLTYRNLDGTFSQVRNGVNVSPLGTLNIGTGVLSS